MSLQRTKADYQRIMDSDMVGIFTSICANGFDFPNA